MTLVAALRQANGDRGASERSVDDVLVVYETGGATEEFKEVLERMARAAWPWKRIVWAYDLLTGRSKLSGREIYRTLETLQERVGVPPGEVEEIWVCYLTRPAERLLFEAFPAARILLYEDGLISYIPLRVAGAPGHADPTRSPIKRARDWLRSFRKVTSPVQRFHYHRYELNIQHRARVSGAFLQLDEAEPLPEALASVPRHAVGYERLRSVLEEVASALDGELAKALPLPGESGPNRILVLGQALSRNKTMPREAELDLYRSVVERILARGCSVLWKEHPRIDEPFFPELKAYADASGRGDGLQPLRLPPAYPVELVASRLGVAGCVVGTSAAPFYLRRLYGIACYTFSDDLLPWIQGVDVFMSRMVAREAAPLSDLTADRSARGPAARAAFEEETA